MEIDTQVPHEVEAEENVFIPLRDGHRVAARVWRPVGEVGPLPAVLEYIPYRKRDLTRGRDSVNHPYLAAHGYVCLRVDLRGSGDSDGVIVDEYREQELSDAEDVIAWAAEQDWCDGNVGMMGISWGGFNSLQVAARQPLRSRRSSARRRRRTSTSTTCTTWAAACSATICPRRR